MRSTMLAFAFGFGFGFPNFRPEFTRYNTFTFRLGVELPDRGRLALALAFALALALAFGFGFAFAVVVALALAVDVAEVASCDSGTFEVVCGVVVLAEGLLWAEDDCTAARNFAT